MSAIKLAMGRPILRSVLRTPGRPTNPAGPYTSCLASPAQRRLTYGPHPAFAGSSDRPPRATALNSAVPWHRLELLVTTHRSWSLALSAPLPWAGHPARERYS